MANTQMGPINTRFVNKIKAASDMGGNDTDLATPLNYTSVSAMRTRLAAISGTTYSSANLDIMTTNDMVYALRVNDDSGTI